MPELTELQKWAQTDPSKLTEAQILAVMDAERKGGLFPGELPFEVERDRQRALDSPSFFATEIVDPYYKENFESVHYAAMDEAFAPYIIGETVRIDGVNYDPKQYIGMLVLFSRDTFKSSMAWLMLFWTYLYTKQRQGYDTRAMYVHQVIKKAVARGENIRNVARHCKRFKQCFPEFRAPKGEWDTMDEWSWPNYAARGSGERSFTAYGETSDKTGGHYTIRIVDDWVTDKSVGTADQLEKSYHEFQAMDPLRDRSRKYNPYLVLGTHYHFQDTYKRAERDGGYLVWRLPAFEGSPKRIFDLCSLDNRTEAGRRKIEVKLRELEKNPPGRLNFPERLGWRELYRSALAQGPRNFNTQMMLNPVPEGEQRFDHEALDACWIDERPDPRGCWLYVRVDPAISEKKKNDETAIIVGGVQWDGKRILMDGWVGREKRPGEIVRKAFTFARKWQGREYRVQNIGIEAVQYQEALAEMARNGVPERDPEYDGESVPMMMRPCPVRSIHRSPDIRKTERLLEMDGPVSRRELLFLRECPIAEKAMLQFKNFPFDRFDALDAIHDLWVGTMTPARPMTGTDRVLHAELRRLIARGKNKKEGIVPGMTNTVRLQAWG